MSTPKGEIKMREWRRGWGTEDVSVIKDDGKAVAVGERAGSQAGVGRCEDGRGENKPGGSMCEMELFQVVQ